MNYCVILLSIDVESARRGQSGSTFRLGPWAVPFSSTSPPRTEPNFFTFVPIENVLLRQHEQDDHRQSFQTKLEPNSTRRYFSTARNSTVGVHDLPNSFKYLLIGSHFKLPGIIGINCLTQYQVFFFFLLFLRSYRALLYMAALVRHRSCVSAGCSFWRKRNDIRQISFPRCFARFPYSSFRLFPSSRVYISTSEEEIVSDEMKRRDVTCVGVCVQSLIASSDLYLESLVAVGPVGKIWMWGLA